MSRAPYKLPSVFVGCPYGGKYPFERVKAALDSVPFAWYYADTKLTTKHLLGILTTYIRAVDYCIFDISLWNPNVALEIGLAEGIGMQYYILLNRNLSDGVPADIQGLQRIDYDVPNGYAKGSLVPSVVKYLVKDYTHPRNIWNALGGENRDNKFYFALSILAHFRSNTYLPQTEIKRLAKGTYLRKEAQTEVLQTMHDQGLITNWLTGKGATLGKSLYPEPLNVK